MTKVTVAATQMACSWDLPKTLKMPKIGTTGTCQRRTDHPDSGAVCRTLLLH